MPMDMMNRPPPAEPVESEDRSRLYLTKAELGGRTPRVGETLTLKITDIDQETGDVEAEIASGETDQTPGYMSDFDESMPEETED